MIQREYGASSVSTKHHLNEIWIIIFNESEGFFNPIQGGGSKKVPSTSFSPVTSTNVGISP